MEHRTSSRFLYLVWNFFNSCWGLLGGISGIVAPKVAVVQKLRCRGISLITWHSSIVSTLFGKEHSIFSKIHLYLFSLGELILYRRVSILVLQFT